MANLRAIFLMIAAMAFFAISDAFINRASLTLGTAQIIAMTGAMGFLFFACVLWWKREPPTMTALFDRAVLIRTAGEVLGTLGYVTALTLVPLATASAMLQAQPLAVTLAAVVFLGEKVGPWRWMAVGAGFLGVIMIVRPGAVGFDPNVLWTLLGIAGLTARDLGTRMLPPRISTAFVSALALACLAVLGLCLTPVFGGWSPVSPAAWGWLIGTTVMVVLAFVSITAALRVGQVSAVAPFRYTRMVFALLIAVIFLGETPDGWTLTGTAIIIASGLFAFWRERRAARAAA